MTKSKSLKTFLPNIPLDASPKPALSLIPIAVGMIFCGALLPENPSLVKPVPQSTTHVWSPDSDGIGIIADKTDTARI